MNDNVNKNTNKRWIAILIFLILGAIFLISLLVWQGLKKPELSKTQGPSILTQATATTSIGNDLFLRTGGGDFSVFISACALDQEVRIVLTPLGQYIGGQDLAGSDLLRPRAVDISFIDKDDQIIEHLELSCPLQVCFTLTADTWVHYLSNPSDFEIQYLNSDLTPAVWVSLPVYENSENHEVCASYSRLGLFSLAFRVQAEPSVTPTSQPGLYEPPGN
jgi:hypothetical protein